jgi:hypothetical protein
MHIHVLIITALILAFSGTLCIAGASFHQLTHDFTLNQTDSSASSYWLDRSWYPPGPGDGPYRLTVVWSISPSNSLTTPPLDFTIVSTNNPDILMRLDDLTGAAVFGTGENIGFLVPDEI